MGLDGTIARRPGKPACREPGAHRAAAHGEPAAAALRGAGGRESTAARHARELGGHCRPRGGLVDPERRPRSLSSSRAARQGRRGRSVQGPGDPRRRGNRGTGFPRQPAHRRGDPDQRRRARDPRAIESQRRAHDRGRNRGPRQAIAAVRDGRGRFARRRPAPVDRHGGRVPARLSRRRSHQGRARSDGDLRQGGSEAHRASRSGARSIAGVVPATGARGDCRAPVEVSAGPAAPSAEPTA